MNSIYSQAENDGHDNTNGTNRNKNRNSKNKFSLGCIIYEILVGLSLFYYSSVKKYSLGVDVSTGKLSHIQPVFKHVISSMIDIHLYNRPNISQIFKWDSIFVWNERNA